MCRGSGTNKKDPAWLKLLVESNKPGLLVYMTNRKKMLPEHVNPEAGTMESSQQRDCGSIGKPMWRRSKTSDARLNRAKLRTDRNNSKAADSVTDNAKTRSTHARPATKRADPVQLKLFSDKLNPKSAKLERNNAGPKRPKLCINSNRPTSTAPDSGTENSKHNTPSAKTLKPKQPRLCGGNKDPSSARSNDGIARPLHARLCKNKKDSSTALSTTDKLKTRPARAKPTIEQAGPRRPKLCRDMGSSKFRRSSTESWRPMRLELCENMEGSKLVLSITRSENTKPTLDRPNTGTKKPSLASWRRNKGKPSFTLLDTNMTGPKHASDRKDAGEPIDVSSNTNIMKSRRAMPKTNIGLASLPEFLDSIKRSICERSASGIASQSRPKD